MSSNVLFITPWILSFAKISTYHFRTISLFTNCNYLRKFCSSPDKRLYTKKHRYNEEKVARTINLHLLLLFSCAELERESKCDVVLLNSRILQFKNKKWHGWCNVFDDIRREKIRHGLFYDLLLVSLLLCFCHYLYIVNLKFYKTYME